MATNLTTDPLEIDTSFTQKQLYLEDLKNKLDVLHKSMTEYLARREDSITAAIKLANSVGVLEDFERQKAQTLSCHYGKLSEVMLSIAKLDQTMAKHELEMFGDALRDQGRYTDAPKRLLDCRLEALKQYQLAQANKAAKQEKSDSGSTAETAIELKKAVDEEAEKKRNYEDLTTKIKEQLNLYRDFKSHNLRLALRELARENIEFGEQSIALWKDLGRTIAEVEPSKQDE